MQSDSVLWTMPVSLYRCISFLASITDADGGAYGSVHGRDVTEGGGATQQPSSGPNNQVPM